MGNLNPLKYCFYGKHSKPRATFRMFPGVENTREMCADCYEKLRASRDERKRREIAVGTPPIRLSKNLRRNLRA